MRARAGILTVAGVAAFAGVAGAQASDEGEAASDPMEELVEELVVTAQRVEESVQDVPIAVTALTGEMLEDKQVITPSDLQLNTPNVSFTATNFGESSFSIRGIGSLVVGRTGEPGVSTHLNELAVPNNLNSTEFFDMERVEVLRGPQGTLFGRNATGGVVNFVTRKAEINAANGFIDIEGGAYSHSRWKGAFNLPLGESFAARLSGFQLRRDGYVENVAHGQRDANGNMLPDIDEDVDGRSIRAFRVSFAWQPTDRLSAWLLHSYFDEDDDRVRISNQVCVRNPLPTTGCLPDEFGFEMPHLGATTAGIFAGLAGALPIGAASGTYHFPRPKIDGFRKMHTDFEPVYDQRETLWAFGTTFALDGFDISLAWSEARQRHAVAARLRHGRQRRPGAHHRQSIGRLARVRARRPRRGGLVGPELQYQRRHGRRRR